MSSWLRKQTDGAFLAAFLVLCWAGWISYVQLRPVAETTRFPFLHPPFTLILTGLGLLGLGYLLSRRGVKAAALAEAAAQNQASILSSVVENMGEGVVVADAGGKYLIMNQSAKDTLGLSDKQLPLEERPAAYGLFLPDGLTPFPVEQLPLARAVKGEASNYVEMMVRNARHPNGIILSITGRSLKDKSGNPQGGLIVARDITFRIRAAEELARKEEYFRSLIESSLDVITTLDATGKVLYESASIEAMAGYRPAELVGKVAFEYVHPEDLPRVMEAFGHVLAKPGYSESVEYRFLHKDGSWKYLESIGRNMLHEPAVAAIVVNTRDVTERRHLEEERQWSNYLSDSSIVLARETRDYESALQSVARMAVPHLADWCSVTVLREDQTEEQIAVAHVDPAKVQWVRTWQKTIPQAPERDTATKRVMRTGKAELVAEVTPAMLAAANLKEEQLDIVKKLEIRSAMTVPLTAEGKPFGVITFVGAESGRHYGPADLARAQELAVKASAAISNARSFAAAQQEIEYHKRQKEEALRQSEERVRLLIENSHDAFISMDSHGLIQSWNGQAEKTFGWTRQEALGRRLSETIIPQRYRDAHERGMERFLSTGEGPVLGRRLELSGLHKDGREFPVELSISAPVHSGDVLVFGAFVRDLSEEKRSEALQLFAQKLEQSNRELLDFTAVVSHDLQEPLRKVQTFGSLVESRLGAAADPAGRDYLRRMQEAASRMQQLIQDLLAFSRVETKAQPFVPVDLAGVAVEVLGDLEARLQQTGGKVELGALPALEADPLQMRQLLQNLIGNGLKFHKAGVPPVVKVSSRPSGAFCEIMVQDNGVGFEEKYLDRIFRAFQRLHSREEFEGTGMGLAICQKIVERHHGSITARSKPGEGSTFVVLLPAKQQGGNK